MSSQKKNHLRYFICGGIGGSCTVLVGHPFETVKVRLQTMPKPLPGQAPLYSGMWDCFRKTVKYEGVSGLYKGMLAPLVAVSPTFAVNFAAYSFSFRVLVPNYPQVKARGRDYFLCGVSSAVCSILIISPIERIKVLLQVQTTGPKLYNGNIDLVQKLYKQGGIKSVYKGTLVTLSRNAPALGMWYFCYESCKDYATDNGRKPVTPLGTLMAGGVAGLGFWVTAMPMDVVKSRYQTAPEGRFPNGTIDVIFELVRKEGLFAFYKGFLPVLIRAFPANAACFGGFELGDKFLSYLDDLFN